MLIVVLHLSERCYDILLHCTFNYLAWTANLFLDLIFTMQFFLKNILEIDWKFLIADIWPQTRSKETPKRTSSSITPTFNLRVRDNQDTSFGME